MAVLTSIRPGIKSGPDIGNFHAQRSICSVTKARSRFSSTRRPCLVYSRIVALISEEQVEQCDEMSH
jgi:hypothetical protein